MPDYRTSADFMQTVSWSVISSGPQTDVAVTVYTCLSGPGGGESGLVCVGKPNFGSSVVGCIEDGFCNQLCTNVTLVEDLSHWPSKVLETERQSLRILQLFSRSTRFAHIRTVANSNSVPSSVRAIWQMPDDFLNVTLFNLQSFA